MWGEGVPGVFGVAITPAGVRDDLVACCEGAAEWRLQKAAEFSGNGRNLAAVDALEAAAESIAALPDDDPGLTRLAWVYDRLGDDQRVLAFTEQRQVVKRHGYDGAAAPSELIAQVTQHAEAILDDRLGPAGANGAGVPLHLVFAASDQPDDGAAGAGDTTTPLAPTGTSRAPR
jgi:hypothetical protein